ncbi:Glycoprotein 3-alpha-L-fucosyltransferase A [Echinococcus granulosus]|uniref:Fucosyltransferase n=1 Tax=Echinococcus granulosus TaxID=6210 RepID=W6UL52_ECHGR|nr:Glycoprotein 3-alpha-L-fucosyltransferase A [Echinococcus granulosus]EUB54234.1 Glycoprotein 3-alpha-L-fucosyltransferase A [Echinococcus granulosus]
MNRSRSSLFFTCWAIANLFILVVLRFSIKYHWFISSDFSHGNKNFSNVSRDQYPYHHVIEQLEWISAFAQNESDLSIVQPPKIYYDRRLLYHVTESYGCRYKCNFTDHLQDFRVGDIAVFSASFRNEDAERLKRNGALIAFESVESPVHMRQLTEIQGGQVDMFITYMPWSQVPYMYPMFLRKTNRGMRFTNSEVSAILAKNSTHLLPSHHRNGKKLIAWLASNGSPRNKRERFVHLISRIIPVDVYGGRGKRTPPGRDALQWISENYKFYLAFENSNCKYYITEKVAGNAYRNGMVPIVLGAYKEEYESVLPPHSFINMDDFNSISKLAGYLQYLDRNDTAYAEYFAWKEYGEIYIEKRLDCRLCGFMHRLNAGLVKLTKYSPSQFMDPRSLCFQRQLPSLV